MKDSTLAALIGGAFAAFGLAVRRMVGQMLGYLSRILAQGERIHTAVNSGHTAAVDEIKELNRTVERMAARIATLEEREIKKQ